MTTPIICTKCSDPLDAEAIEYCQQNLSELRDIGIGYICQSHWCDCMPRTTPWRYLTNCTVCGDSVCKSCKTETRGGGLICAECREYLTDRW